MNGLVRTLPLGTVLLSRVFCDRKHRRWTLVSSGWSASVQAYVFRSYTEAVRYSDQI